MAIITLPSIPATSMEFRLLRGDQAIVFFGGASVIYAPPEAIWLLSFPLKVQRISQARIWYSRLVQLSKLSNQFQAGPVGIEQSLQYGGAQPLVAGADQLGTSLDFDGADNSTTVLGEGDFFSVNGELKLLTSSMDSDGAGAGTVTFEPALRQAPADNAPIEVVNPVGTFRLVSPEAVISGRPPRHFNMTVEAIEHFGP